MICLITTLCLLCVLFQPGYLEQTFHRAACEPQSTHLHLSCDGDTVIVITRAEFGHTNSQTCPPTSCKDTSINIPIQSWCNGRKVCDVALKDLPPSQCKGSYAYVTTYHHCEPKRHVKACENSVARLDCGVNGAIYIFQAQYGRMDKDSCPSADPNAGTSCINDATFYMQRRCNLMQTCEVPVQSSMFVGSCSGPSNYLEASYICHKTTTGCEGETINLSCEPGTTINLGKRFYGRNDTTTCVAGRRPEEISNTNCKQSVYGHPHISGCEGKTSCQIEVNPTKLGEPCPGTFKYLYVHYNCYRRPT
ncbi:L-rhamnose-binding lectin CSL3-like [Antennarius striatus]|uniref:L-rhamnose-binding lectin CSL3-like n=1 Tax=Antennarius striatus TaxID=241820 RepID=UPI0035AFBFE4